MQLSYKIAKDAIAGSSLETACQNYCTYPGMRERLREMASGAAAVAAHYVQLLVAHGTSTQLLLLVSSLLMLLLAASIHVVATTASGRRRVVVNTNNLRQLPPSPPGKLPVIGHLHLVGSLPPASLRDLAAKHGRDGLLLRRLGDVPTLVVSSPRAAEAVLRTHDHVLSSRPWSPVADILFYGASSVGFAPYGDEWRGSRKVVAARMLSARKVESFRLGRLDEVRVVLARLREAADGGTGTAVDVSEAVSAYANDVVCRAVLGESHRAGGRNRLLMELAGMNVALLGGFNLEDYFPRLTRMELLRRLICRQAEKVHRRWDQLFDKLIHEHQQHQQADESTITRGEEDLIHVLLGAEEEYGLTRDNVKALLMETFQAGIESSYLVLDYAMAELMLNRHVMARLQTEVRTTPLLASAGKKQDMVVMEEDLSKMSFLKAVVKETLRLHPPAPLLIPRLSTTDCDINGCYIPAGTRIFVNAWALGRDPASWDRAEEFMPERFLQQEVSGSDAAAPDMKGTDFAFLPFGAGRRICPGRNFGIATVEIMLANLMCHFDWKLQKEGTSGAGGGDVDMSEVFGMALRRKEKLFLVPTTPASS